MYFTIASFWMMVFFHFLVILVFFGIVGNNGLRNNELISRIMKIANFRI